MVPVGANESQKKLSEELKAEAKNLGFNLVGIATVPESSRIKLRTAALQRWLNAGHQAGMKWMEAPRRQNIESLLKGVKSVLAVGLNYYIETDKKPNTLSIARYSWGNDYHKVLTKRLKKLGRWLESKRPESKWKVCVDSSSFMDKAWAEEAGIGWIGKNSNIINPEIGSWIVLGHLLSTEILEPDKSAIASCGKCEKCIEECPTNAISEPFVVNANRCLAYHTIENRDHELPTEIKQSLGSWVAGCDICQEVCPWNKKSKSNFKDPDIQPKEWVLNLTKEKALTWDDKIWKEKLQGSALKRIKPWMWRRNAESIN